VEQDSAIGERAGAVLVPSFAKEIDNSSLKQSRLLYGYASQCVSMQVPKAEQLANADKRLANQTTQLWEPAWKRTGEAYP